MILDGIGKKNELNTMHCKELDLEFGLNGTAPSPAQGWSQIQLTDSS